MALCCRVFLRISGAMCSLTFNFASPRIKSFLAFTRKYLPQFCVSTASTKGLKISLKLHMECSLDLYIYFNFCFIVESFSLILNAVISLLVHHFNADLEQIIGIKNPSCFLLARIRSQNIYWSF